MLVFVLMLVAEGAALLSGFVCPPTVVAAFAVVLSRLFDLVVELHLIAADVVVVVVVVVAAVALFCPVLPCFGCSALFSL